jgi:hypothetical protein
MRALVIFSRLVLPAEAVLAIARADGIRLIWSRVATPGRIPIDGLGFGVAAILARVPERVARSGEREVQDIPHGDRMTR